MKGKREHEALFELAAADLILVAKNLGDPEIRPQLLFFHLQQAVEKFLKSLLSFYGQRFPRTHDIAELIVLCRKAGIELPEWIEELIGLTPFAVELRYGLPADEIPDISYFFKRVSQLKELVEKEIGVEKE
jgi:HEPN domain-containing protein